MDWTFFKITSIFEVPYVPNLKVVSPVLVSEESEKIFDEVPHLHIEAMNICQRYYVICYGDDIFSDDDGGSGGLIVKR